MRSWQEMTHEELTEELEAGREEAQRRMRQMASLLGIGGAKPGKPGRKSADPLAALFAGEGLESQDEDSANGAAS
jgi:hypothetical protein